MTLVLNITTDYSGSYERPRGLGATRYDIAIRRAKAFSEGVGQDQADIFYQSSPGGRTLALSTFEDLDLAGVLPDAIGDTLALVRVKALYVYAYATNTHDVIVGGAAANAWLGPFGAAAHTLKIAPDAWIKLVNPTAAGWPITAGTADLLRVANGGAVSPVTYDIAILGASA